MFIISIDFQNNLPFVTINKLNHLNKTHSIELFFFSFLFKSLKKFYQSMRLKIIECLFAPDHLLDYLLNVAKLFFCRKFQYIIS